MMNAQSKLEASALAKLREPFPAHQISKLPKPTKAQTDEVKADFKKGVRCTICGAWHHPNVVHLDYVGHAALTDRLLDTDPLWTWEPVGFTPDGLPARDQNGGMWIKLTVCGVTRFGYGSADGKTGGDAVKEIIGDALRNAAMRFGAALDLWHKGELHADEEKEDGPKPDPTPDPRGPEPTGDVVTMITGEQRDLIQTLAPTAGKTTQGICEAYKIRALTELTYARAVKLIEHLRSEATKAKAVEVLDDEIPY